MQRDVAGAEMMRAYSPSATLVALAGLALIGLLGVVFAQDAPAPVQAEPPPAKAVEPVIVTADDPVAGEKTFAKCRSCHSIGPGARNAVGPQLNGIVGRRSGSAPAFSYSAGLKALGITWTEVSLREFLKNPQAKVPGTKMVFGGLRQDVDIGNVLAYVGQFDAKGRMR